MKELRNKDNFNSNKSEMGPSSKRFVKKKPSYRDKPDENKINGIKIVPVKRRHVVDEATRALRRLYNKLRDKDTKVNSKHEIITKMLKIVGTNITNFCYKHDGSRMLQACIKHGNKEQRANIYNSLKDIYYDLILKNYSIYLASKIFRFSENKEREQIVNLSILPHFNKLVTSIKGQAFLNLIFKHSNLKIQELLFHHYLNKYMKISLESIRESFKEKVKENENNTAILIEQQSTFGEETVRQNLTAHLEKQLEKSIHKTYVFQFMLDNILIS